MEKHTVTFSHPFLIASPIWGVYVCQQYLTRCCLFVFCFVTGSYVLHKVGKGYLDLACLPLTLLHWGYWRVTPHRVYSVPRWYLGLCTCPRLYVQARQGLISLKLLASWGLGLHVYAKQTLLGDRDCFSPCVRNLKKQDNWYKHFGGALLTFYECLFIYGPREYIHITARM